MLKYDTPKPSKRARGLYGLERLNGVYRVPGASMVEIVYTKGVEGFSASTCPKHGRFRG